MDFEDYLLGGVAPEEFTALKNQESKLVASVMEGFNDSWKPRIQGIKIAFKYNPKRNIIGIYVERQGQQTLVIGDEGLNEAESAVVRTLYSTLEVKLARLRLPKEKWVDSIPEDKNLTK